MLIRSPRLLPGHPPVGTGRPELGAVGGPQPRPPGRHRPASPRSRRRSRPGCTSGSANGFPGCPSWSTPPSRIAHEQTRLLAAAAGDRRRRGRSNTRDSRYRRIGRRQDRTTQRLQYRPEMVLIEDIATASSSTSPATRTRRSGPGPSSRPCGTPASALEELLEITHLALVSYQLPDTGEIVPAAADRPVQEQRGTAAAGQPRTGQRPGHRHHPAARRQRRHGPAGRPLRLPRAGHRAAAAAPLPAPDPLETRRHQHQHALPAAQRHHWPGPACTDQPGEPLRFTPHDFRRIFATEAVTGGLPVHIAARLLGHTSTCHHTVIPRRLPGRPDPHLPRLPRPRRADRPAEEYREPTDEEWREFQQHFQPASWNSATAHAPTAPPASTNTPACAAPCSGSRPATPPARSRSSSNLTDRIAEARTNGWLGEVQGLQVSLTKAKEKLVALDRSLERARGNGMSSPTDLGMPAILGRQ